MVNRDEYDEAECNLRRVVAFIAETVNTGVGFKTGSSCVIFLSIIV